MKYSDTATNNAKEVIKFANAILEGKVIEYRLNDEFVEDLSEKLVKEKGCSKEDAIKFITVDGRKSKWTVAEEQGSILENGFNLFRWSYRVKED